MYTPHSPLSLSFSSIFYSIPRIAINILNGGLKNSSGKAYIELICTFPRKIITPSFREFHSIFLYVKTLISNLFFSKTFFIKISIFLIFIFCTTRCRHNYFIWYLLNVILKYTPALKHAFVKLLCDHSSRNLKCSVMESS